MNARSRWKYVVHGPVVRYLGCHIYAFLAGILGGVVAILPDIDHPLSLLFGLGYPRFLHQWFLAISCIALLGCSAYFGRLLYRAILKVS